MTHKEITIEKLNPALCEKWDAYVKSHPHGSFFHLCGWQRVIEQVYGHETIYLFAHEKKQNRWHITTRLYS